MIPPGLPIKDETLDTIVLYRLYRLFCTICTDYTVPSVPTVLYYLFPYIPDSLQLKTCVLLNSNSLNWLIK